MIERLDAFGAGGDLAQIQHVAPMVPENEIVVVVENSKVSDM